MCRRLLVLFLSLLPVLAFRPESAPTRDEYSRIDAYARSAPQSVAGNINSLADYLTTPARTDMDKVRVIYAWIVSHIRYDIEAANSPYRQKYYSEKEFATRTLRARKGLCTGYALLFKFMLERAGVQAVSIRGYARTEDREAGNPVPKIDHEWNAVNIEGDWYLFDLAWAVSTANEGEISNDFYFMTPPSQFVAQHFPTEARWQLLDQPVAKARFDRFPKLYAPYFNLGFGPSFPQEGRIDAMGKAELTLETDFSMEYLCTVGRPGQGQSKEVPVTVTRENGRHRLLVNLPVRGTSTLHVYARPRSKERYKRYDCIASFTVQNG